MTIFSAVKDFFTCKSACETYEHAYTCKICEKVEHITLLVNPHIRVMQSEIMKIKRGPFGMTQVEYGDFNKRKMWVCSSHKDSEIKSKLEEII